MEATLPRRPAQGIEQDQSQTTSQTPSCKGFAKEHKKAA
jgi:hypothetical protein